MTKTTPPVVLCFSGADPTGGAGIQADIETLCSHGCVAASIITAATVQDTVDVISFAPMPSDLVIEQARPVFSTETDGALSTEDLVDTVRTLLLPVTKVLTPNIHEIHALAPGSDTPTAAAMGLLESDVEYILLTGTHGKTADVTHTLFSNNRELESFHYQRLPHKYHGSGCTLAASVAAQIALGQDVLGAARKGLDYTYKTLLNANRIGMGQYHPNRFFWDK